MLLLLLLLFSILLKVADDDGEGEGHGESTTNGTESPDQFANSTDWVDVAVTEGS